MKIEVLYVPECPNLPAALKQLEHVLADEGIEANFQQILVADERMAHDLKFHGSPTIRINGRDIVEDMEGEEDYGPSSGLTCRLYPGSGAGVPSAEAMRRALREARLGAKQ